jgi:hypothetical protein
MDKPRKIKNRERWMKKYFNRFQGRETSNYDEMIQGDYNRAIERAHALSSITKEDYASTQPVLITVPDSYTDNDRVAYRLDKLQDGTMTLRYDQSLVTTLFFGEDTLYYHQCNIDHRDGRIGFDVAGEFNYFDVVHMETAIKHDKPEHPKYIILDLELTLTDGTIVPIHLRNHRLHEGYELPGLLTDKEQHILDTIKAKVRGRRLSD